jgi:hypothetical protein
MMRRFAFLMLGIIYGFLVGIEWLLSIFYGILSAIF